MTRNALKSAVDANMATTKDALQLLFDRINKGQQKQLVKQLEIKSLFDRYGVKYENVNL